MGRRGFRCLAILVVLSVPGTFGPASAQQLDSDEITRRLEAQQKGYARTRGLKLITNEPPAVATSPEMPSTVVTADPPTFVPDGRYESLGAYDAPQPAPTVAASPEPTVQQYDSIGSLDALDTDAVPAVPRPYVSQRVEELPPLQYEAAPAPAVETYRPVPEAQRVNLEIFFEWNSAALDSRSRGQLRALCTALSALGDGAFRIIGHTDKSGSAEYNRYLSSARAREVRRHLIEECGIAGNRLRAQGEGESQASPDTPERAPEERRVEIQAAPLS